MSSTLTTLQTAVNNLSQCRILFCRPTVASSQQIAGFEYSQWTCATSSQGFPPAPSSNPTGSITYTKSTQGGLQFPAPPTSTSWYLARMDLGYITSGTLRLIDRYVSVGGLVFNVTTSQTVNTPALPSRAPTNGVGCQMYLECYGATAPSTTSATMTVTYTNQAGTSGQTSTFGPVVVGSASSSAKFRLMEIPLAAGDTGVQSVQSVQWSTAPGGTGNWCLLIAKNIAEAPISGERTQRMPQDIIATTLPKIDNNACLFFAFSSPITSGNSEISGTINLISG